jgi:hypothetical protein
LSGSALPFKPPSLVVVKLTSMVETYPDRIVKNAIARHSFSSSSRISIKTKQEKHLKWDGVPSYLKKGNVAAY